MQANHIRTSEEDYGLWSVWQGERKLGVIWQPEKEAKWWSQRNHEAFTPDEPQFIALEDWLSCVPGNPIEGCKTWHKALAAVVANAKR